MGTLAIALGGLIIVLFALANVRVLRRRRNDAAQGAAPEEGPASATKNRPDTALGELRDLREALNPAEHTRVERRRTPNEIARTSGERRRKRPR